MWADGAAAIGTATRVSRLARGDDVRKSQIYTPLYVWTRPARDIERESEPGGGTGPPLCPHSWLRADAYSADSVLR